MGGPEGADREGGGGPCFLGARGKRCCKKRQEIMARISVREIFCIEALIATQRLQATGLTQHR